MNWRIAGLLAVAGMIAAPSASMAGPYGDDLTKCFIESSGADGQILFIQWMFVSMGKNPAVQQYINATADQKIAIDKKIAELWQRLLTKDCREKTVLALKYEGQQDMIIAFQALGQAAARTIMSGPETATAMNSYLAYVDWDKISALFKDAGLPPPLVPQTKP